MSDLTWLERAVVEASVSPGLTRADLPALMDLAKRIAMSAVEQSQVQLAGVSVAAFGGTSEPVRAKEGDYGWSVAYQDVLSLREKYDRLRDAITKALE